jgi:hypothetical protein
VNFATSSYDQRNLSSLYNPQQYSNNTKTSSVSYSRNFPEIGLNLSSTFNISQNTRDSSISVTLPDLNISLNRIYPFKRKKAVGDERWYEKISLQYTGQMTNSINTKDNLILKQGLNKWTNGMQHKIPISATFTLFKYINVVPSFNYTERWYMRKVEQSYDPSAPNNVRRDTINGFNRVYNYDLSLQVNTKMYGFYKPWKKLFGDKIEMIRHVFTPSVSMSYAPDFSTSRYGYVGTYTYTDTDGEVRTQTYNPYEGLPYSFSPSGKSENFTFSIDNNVEMKVKSDADTTGVKKISLIDQLGASISYNAAAKEKPWGNLSMNLRLKLTKSYTFNMNAQFATYAYEFDKDGKVVEGNRTEWSYGRFGRFQGYSGSFSYTLNNDSWKKWFGPKDEKVFAPEHGFRGDADAGETIRNGKDTRTGIPILSLYGKNKKPTATQLQDIDLIVFDIQDVGARFYTYISTMQYVMEACAENRKQLVITDRPNPCDYVDGPVRQKNQKSFVGMHAIPILHGCTVGELAQMINGEGWLPNGKKCALTVIPVEGWKHGQI